jgi:hypothetical protein
LINALRAEFPDFVYTKNDEKPKRLSFEIFLVKDNDGNYFIYKITFYHVFLICIYNILVPIQIWSGVDRKPRKEKFPDHSFIIEEINKHF